MQGAFIQGEGLFKGLQYSSLYITISIQYSQIQDQCEPTFITGTMEAFRFVFTTAEAYKIVLNLLILLTKLLCHHEKMSERH